MNPERVAEFFNEQADLYERQNGAVAEENAHVETIADVQEWYGNLVERILELPTYGDSPTELWDERRYLDRHFHTTVVTGDTGFPEAYIRIHTGHVLTSSDQIKDPRDSSDISVDWYPAESTRDSGKGGAPAYHYQESLSRPTEHTDVAEASRMLGLIEASVAAAEEAIAAKTAPQEA